MKFVKEIVLNNRPHPGPLPQERGKCVPSLSGTSGWISRTIFRKSRNAHLLFPLPGGEGQGEGERNR